MLCSSSPSTGWRPGRLIWILVLLSLMLGACREKAPIILSRFTAFGDTVDVSLIGVTREQAEQASALIASDFAYLERDWWPGGSGALDRVNRLLARGEPFVAPPSLLPLVRLGQSLELDSAGLYNPAIGQLAQLWGFDGARPIGRSPPTGDEIARLVSTAPSMAQIRVEGLTLTGGNPALRLDFTGVAQGRAIDLAIERLKDLGIRNALVQSDGALRAIGERSGQPWRIPILRPNGSAVLAMLPIRGDEGLVTLAEHDRNFVFKGRLYHSVIDPRTGWPAEGARSVSVAHASTALAAAAARALFIAGPDDWTRIATRLGIDRVLLVDLEGRVNMTRAMAERIELVDAGESVQVVDLPRQSSSASGIRPR